MLHLLVVTTLFYTGQVAEPAADFAILFDHKGCHYEYLDTFKGTYSPFGGKVVPFALSSEQKSMLFTAIMAAGFFDLPTMKYGSSTEPADNYELEVRNAGRRHSVSWTNEWMSRNRSFLDLHRTIFKVLPGGGGHGDGCVGGPPEVR
jgi:hypothetical protein